MKEVKEIKDFKEIKERFFNLLNFINFINIINIIISSTPRPFFDFRGADFVMTQFGLDGTY